MRAQHVAQRRMQEVSSAVVEHGGGATRVVDRADQMVAALERTGGQYADVAMELTGELLRVVDLEHHALFRQLTGVTHLATAFGVERRPLEENDGLVARADGVDGLAMLEQRDHFQA